MIEMRGYIVTGIHPEDGAVLVFAYTAREAKRMGWGTIVNDYATATYPEVRVKWARDADPKVWGVTEPVVLEPDGCEACFQWYTDAPLSNANGLCALCAEGIDDG